MHCATSVHLYVHQRYERLALLQSLAFPLEPRPLVSRVVLAVQAATEDREAYVFSL